MRQRQSSVTRETQYPVMSMTAAALGGNGEPPRPRPGLWAISVLAATRISHAWMLMLFFLAEFTVHSLDELICGPGSVLSAITAVVVVSRFGCFDLFQG